MGSGQWAVGSLEVEVDIVLCAVEFAAARWFEGGGIVSAGSMRCVQMWFEGRGGSW